jgi:hypothetical protein
MWGYKKLLSKVHLEENDYGEFDEGDLDMLGRRGLGGI